jgi:hypothetical protein
MYCFAERERESERDFSEDVGNHKGLSSGLLKFKKKM